MAGLWANDLKGVNKDFLQFATNGGGSGDTSTLDPGKGGTEPPPPPPDGPPGDIPVEVNQPIEPPLEGDFIPADFSGGAGAAQGQYGDMGYTVPEAGDTPIPDSAGHTDPQMTPWDVTREQTVAGQLEDLYNRDSPFMEQARQRAIRSNLASGGQNSAMAGAFGELAAMDVAFKVGFADAATYARSAEFNAAMSNQFSLAEQQFVHNAVLSDQAFQQSKILQTQRIAAQFEAIVLDYKGRSNLMDKELDQWFLKAKQDHQYQLDKLYATGNIQQTLNNSLQLSNFYIAGFQSVMDAANNPNLTPQQSAAALREGMTYLRQQWDFLYQFLLGM